MNTLREAASAREGPGQRGRSRLMSLYLLQFYYFSSFWLSGWTGCSDCLRVPEYPVNLFISIPLLSVGAGLLFWSAICFVRQTGKLLPVGATPKLIKGGPYELARNPMFTGIFFILFGIGFASQSISLVFIFTLLFILLAACDRAHRRTAGLKGDLVVNTRSTKKIHRCFIRLKKEREDRDEREGAVLFSHLFFSLSFHSPILFSASRGVMFK